MDERGLLRGRRPAGGPSLDRYPPAGRSLSRLLRDRASTQPDGTWLVFDGDRRLSFGLAYHQAQQVAGRLRHEYGDRPRVGIALRACPELVVALHGVLLAGGVAHLVDPSLPAAARHRLLGGAGVTALVAGTVDAPVVGTTPWEQWLRGPRAGAALPLPHAGDDAIVMFTSGTTGTPKGVVCSHHFTFVYSALVTDSLGRGPGDVLTTALPMYHASGLHMVVHSALHAGAVGHLQHRFSASRFFVDAARDGATQAALVPEMARMIARRARPAPHRLEFVIAGGMSDHASFARQFAVPVLWQGYGMTEAYPIPMARRPASADPRALGMPVDLFSYGVVGRDGGLRGPDQPGELVLRPHHELAIFTRYLGDEAATRRARDGGLFRTGDLVSVDRDGVLRFAGRAGGRIRHRGEHIDPSEVETAALGCEPVVEAAAYGVPSELGDEEVKLDVTGPEPIDLAELHRRLREQLRPAAVPRYLEQRAALPRTPSFRVRRHELRAEGVERPTVLDTGDG